MKLSESKYRKAGLVVHLGCDTVFWVPMSVSPWKNITNSSLQANYHIAVAHPDLQIRGAQSSGPWDKGWGSKRNFLSSLWASVWSKNEADLGPPGSSPGSTTALIPLFPLLPCLFVTIFPLIKILLSLKINLIITIPKKIILNLTIHNGHACWTLSQPKQQCKILKGIENMCWITWI